MAANRSKVLSSPCWRGAPSISLAPKLGEFFILEGALEDAEGCSPTGTWLWLPAGSTLEAISRDGCVAYVKTGALPTLRSA